MRAAWRLALAIALATSTAVAKPKAPPPPPPEPPPADVETAESLYTKLDYDKANDVAARVLKKSGLSHDQLVRATKILAITDAILDKEEDAKDTFLTLLILDPEQTVDANLGPKVSGPFVEARGRYRSLPSKPGIEVTPSIRADGGKLKIVTRDPTKLTKKVNVGYRWLTTGDYTLTTVSVGEAVVDVAAAPAGRTRLDFYAQALDDHENGIFESGNAAVPKSAFAETGPKQGAGGKQVTEEKKGVLSSPVFWIIAGAVVAGGAATGAFFLFRKDDPATTASLTPQIRCGSDLCK